MIKKIKNLFVSILLISLFTGSLSAAKQKSSCCGTLAKTIGLVVIPPIIGAIASIYTNPANPRYGAAQKAMIGLAISIAGLSMYCVCKIVKACWSCCSHETPTPMPPPTPRSNLDALVAYACGK